MFGKHETSTPKLVLFNQLDMLGKHMEGILGLLL